jgi:pyruvate-formate lyase-activating enzyme
MNEVIDAAFVDEIEGFINKRQTNYGQHLSVSLTNRCPLRCKHCFTNASPSNGVDMDIKMVSNIASQLKDLQGTIKDIGITGGEPFLRPDEIKIISEAGKQIGATVGVVSSGYWATSRLEAEHIIGEFEDVCQYNFSTDVYHLQFVPLTNIKNAYEAAKKKGKQVTIRFTESCGNLEKEKHLLEEIRVFAGKDIHIQNLIPFGRAEHLDEKYPFTRKKPPVPCLSTGPTVCEDGAVLPCCNALLALRHDHSLVLGNVAIDTLSAIYKKNSTNTIFHFLRLWGSQGLYELLRKSPLSNLLPKKHLYFDPCYTCAKLFSIAQINKYLAELAMDFELRLKVASGLWHYLKDPIFLEELFKDEDFKSRVNAL